MKKFIQTYTHTDIHIHHFFNICQNYQKPLKRKDFLKLALWEVKKITCFYLRKNTKILRLISYWKIHILNHLRLLLLDLL